VERVDDHTLVLRSPKPLDADDVELLSSLLANVQLSRAEIDAAWGELGALDWLRVAFAAAYLAALVFIARLVMLALS
jgi:hypothetical protein